MINTVADLMLRLKSDRRGVTALEYGLLASLIGLAIVAAVTTFSTNLSGLFTAIGNKL
jgi:pilus assembly protein Flp/PilA